MRDLIIPSVHSDIYESVIVKITKGEPGYTIRQLSKALQNEVGLTGSPFQIM
jgi:hypothetical protein